jgi:hypothetical protein
MSVNVPREAKDILGKEHRDRLGGDGWLARAVVMDSMDLMFSGFR